MCLSSYIIHCVCSKLMPYFVSYYYFTSEQKSFFCLLYLSSCLPSQVLSLGTSLSPSSCQRSYRLRWRRCATCSGLSVSGSGSMFTSTISTPHWYLGRQRKMWSTSLVSSTPSKKLRKRCDATNNFLTKSSTHHARYSPKITIHLLKCNILLLYFRQLSAVNI